MGYQLYRDQVISIVKGEDLVGVYIILDDGKSEPKELVLAEMSPEKADKIIKLWNN